MSAGRLDGHGGGLTPPSGERFGTYPPLGQRTLTTTSTDAQGRFEARIRLDDQLCDGGDWSVHLDVAHPRYGAGFSVPVGCSRRTVDVRLLSHVTGVRIEPATGEVAPGSVTAFTAVVVLADGTELSQPDPEVWELFWAFANDVVPGGACGALEDAGTNPVLFHAPTSPPAGDCSSEGGAAVSLQATAYGVAGGAADEFVQIVVVQE